MSVRYVCPLTEQQRALLESTMKHDASPRARMHAHGLLLSSEGITIQAIAKIYLRRPNRRFTVDQLLGSECHRRLFDARWPCIFNDQGLIWNHELRSIVFFINPFHTDIYLII